MGIAVGERARHYQEFKFELLQIYIFVWTYTCQNSNVCQNSSVGTY